MADTFIDQDRLAAIWTKTGIGPDPDELSCIALELLQRRHEQTKTDKAKSLRDEFAMAALSGLLAAPDTAGNTPNAIVAMSYRYGDAMLEARKVS